MLNNYSNYGCPKVNVWVEIPKNKQNWKKREINIKVLQFKYLRLFLVRLRYWIC